MNTWCGLALACLLAAVSVVVGMYGDSDFYGDPATDRLLEELQKRLAEANEAPADRFYSDFGSFPWYSNEISAELRDDENMQEDIREPEHLSFGSQSQGFQYISGGAGEGKQELKPEGDLKNMQEVKSDEGLPFYCHPPNPCPKGYAAKDGCHDFIQDTVEEQQTWITKMMEKGMCTCDKEHMFSCPKEFAEKPESEDPDADPSQMDEILDYMNWEAKQQAADKPKWKNGEKLKVVAKKSPIVKRSVANEDAIEAELDRMKKRADWHHNPYLKGGKISTYAKKG